MLPSLSLRQCALPAIVFMALLHLSVQTTWAGELKSVRPGITEREKGTANWSIDFAKPDAELKDEATKLSSRLYGMSKGKLHQPMIIEPTERAAGILAFEVGKVSRGGAILELEAKDGKTVRLSWPVSSKTHQVSTIYYVPLSAELLPAKLQVLDPNGVVVMSHYYLADTLEQLPTDVEKVKLELTERPAQARANGYRGIWFTLGKKYKYGDKYSGGLGTYPANHLPFAVYSPKANKTFFTYGGTKKGKRHLLLMASYYDHTTGTVPQPVIVHDKNGVDDPHDNATINIDDQGHIWIFVSGRGGRRPGFKYRSRKPYDISSFDLITTEELAYPQIHWLPGKGFMHLFTKYTNGRELYWETSPDGIKWSPDRKYAGIEGHYQVSGNDGTKVGTFFNRHPGHSVDKRTDIYYIQTIDMGKTWTTVDGTELELPLTNAINPALVKKYWADGQVRTYPMDMNFDKDGNPILLYVTSKHYAPGPQGDPREWIAAHWDGSKWLFHKITKSTHNYDMGSLYVKDGKWTVIGPTAPGPQKMHTGGEMVIWESTDQGSTWTKVKQITKNSKFNHSYARRPLRAKDPFFAFWADGNADKFSESRFYFSDSKGNVYRLPYDMESKTATPEKVDY